MTHVRLRQRGYETLKAYVEAQADLAPLASYDERLAAVGEGVQVWKNRMDAVFADDAGTEVALATWADALDGWPLWVIRSAFRHCNTSRQHPPMPVDVIAVCEELWGKGRRQMVRAKHAVEDCERLRPEWVQDDF